MVWWKFPSFLRTVFALLITRLSLQLFPFSFCEKIVRSLPAPRAPRERILWAVDAAGRRVPGCGNCLAKALVTRHLLERSGVEASLHFGVERQGPRLGAHAWVESGGRIVMGQPEPGSVWRPMKAAVILAVLSFLSADLPPLAAQEIPDQPAGSSAEVVERQTRTDLEELLKAPAPVFKLSLEEEEAAPAEEPKAAFHVKSIRVEGNTIIPEADLRRIVGPFEEREQTLDDLNLLCRALEAEYQQRGYVAIVYVPPQRMEKQEALLKVLISRLGEVRVEGARYFREAMTLAYWRIPKEEYLRVERIRSNVIPMNDNPDRSVKVLLKSGKERGYTDVILHQEDRSPLHAGVSVDNYGTKLTGKIKTSGWVRHNNAFGHDDVFLVNAAFANEVENVYLYHFLPLPAWDVRLASHYSYARVTPRKEFEQFDLYGVAQDYGMELRRWLFREERASLEGFVSFTFNEKRTRAQGAVIAKDRLRMPSIGVDYQSADPGGIWQSRASFKTGVPFHDENSGLTSRQSGSSFTKLNFKAKRIQVLPGNARGVLNVEGQWTPDNLAPQEEFFLGGPDTIRGYPVSDYGGDYGYLINLEYWFQATKKLDAGLFADYGYGRLVNSLSAEHVTRNLFSPGIAFTYRFDDNLQASLSWGFPLAESPLTESGSSQTYLKVQRSF